jgi:hypothetical protein
VGVIRVHVVISFVLMAKIYGCPVASTIGRTKCGD